MLEVNCPVYLCILTDADSLEAVAGGIDVSKRGLCGGESPRLAFAVSYLVVALD